MSITEDRASVRLGVFFIFMHSINKPRVEKSILLDTEAQETPPRRPTLLPLMPPKNSRNFITALLPIWSLRCGSNFCCCVHHCLKCSSVVSGLYCYHRVLLQFPALKHDPTSINLKMKWCLNTNLDINYA